jgi:glycosyl transferase family 87
MKRILLTSIAGLAVLYAIGVTWRKNERAAGVDYYIYFVAGQLAGRADVDNIYSAEVQERVGEEYFERAQRGSSELRKYDAQRRRRLDNVSSPFLYTTLRWMSRNYDRALTQDHVLVLGAFIAGVLLIARRMRLSWATALFLLAGLLLYYRGFEADLRVGNVNSLQLLMLAIALWSPPALAGAILGMLLCFKPNLIFVALLLAIAHDRRRLRLELLGGLAGAAVAIVAAAVSYGGFHVWVQWITAANQFWHRIPTRMERNVTPALAIFQEHGTWPSYALAAVLFAVAAVAVLGPPPSRRLGRRRPAAAASETLPAQPAGTPAVQDHDRDLLIAGVGILIYLISATVVWLHYMVLVVPVAIALMRWRATAIVALIALALIAEVPFEMLVRKPAAPVEAMLITPALAALFLCAVWKLSNRDPAAA